MDYIGSTVQMSRTMSLGKTVSAFHRVAVQGCTSSICSSTQAERFNIAHPSNGGVWTTGIKVR
jgi:hypothetical protein